MARMQSASQAIITCTGWCCRALYERQHRRRTRASTVLGRSSYSQMHPQPSIKEDEHKPEGHAYQRDNSLPTGTAGTHFAGVLRQTFTTSAWTTKPSRRFFATATSG